MQYTKENYRKYLKSTDWINKRANKLKKTNNCAICNSKTNLDVHHIFYKNWYDVETSDLRILCRECHSTTHKLMNEWVIIFKKWWCHLSRFAILKHKVKHYLWYRNKNMFTEDKTIQVTMDI